MIPALMGLLGGVATTIYNKYQNDQANDAAGHAADAANKANYEAQKEFAQNGLRWKVEDARAAGIHPLAALGAQGASYSPSFTAFAPRPQEFDSRWAYDMGQDVGRAVSAGSTQVERDNAKIRALQIERGELENLALLSDLAKQNGQLGPGLPEIGKISGFAPQPNRPVITEPKGGEPGYIPSHGWLKTSEGGYARVPGKDIKERVEDNPVQEMLYNIRNLLLPNLAPNDPRYTPPDNLLPEGAVKWYWDVYRQQYFPVYKAQLQGIDG